MPHLIELWPVNEMSITALVNDSFQTFYSLLLLIPSVYLNGLNMSAHGNKVAIVKPDSAYRVFTLRLFLSCQRVGGGGWVRRSDCCCV